MFGGAHETCSVCDRVIATAYLSQNMCLCVSRSACETVCVQWGACDYMNMIAGLRWGVSG